MIFDLGSKLALIALSISCVAQAQVASGTTSSTIAASTWTVNVGKLDHKFDPEVVTANIGDTILFQFYPRNHSVVRAA
jgi:plastocyanin